MRPGGYVSRKPIRRLVHTGRGFGNYGVAGFAGSSLRDSSAYLLNPSQINDLLNRNPQVNEMLNGIPPSGSWSIGYQFTDAVYGDVLISVDATGNTNFVANSPIATAVVNAPPYVSPTNPPGTAPGCTDSIADFLGCAQGAGQVLLLIGGGYLLYRMLK